MRTAVVMAFLIFLIVDVAMACPVCSSGTGQQVRAERTDELLGVSILATVAPFMVVLAIVAALHFGPPRFRRKP